MTVQSSRILTAALICCAALIMISPSLASAQSVPPLLSHQGRLFGADNAPLSGSQTLTFRVYDAADEAGVELWSETQDLSLSNGYYSVVLGQTSALPDTVFDGSTRYLGVTVGDATVVDELAPRLEVTSVAYALKSAEAENATGDLTPTSVTVGGATIATDGTITLGAATVNTDGSIVVGNTTINADGSISVAGNPVIGSDGSVDASAFSGTTLSDLEAGGCTTGQLPQFDAIAGWGCITPAAGTAYSAGAGLTLDATDTFSVDPTQVQTRLSGACNPGEFMLGANEDGSVNCALEHVYTGGSGVVVTTVGDTSTIGVDFGVAQQRVSGTCTGTDKITAINADGSVACSPDVDTDTTYAAGAGVNITGTTISLIDTVDDDTTYTAGAGVDITGTTISLVDTVDDDTIYSAGSGLTLTGTQFAADTAALQARVTGVCGAGEYVQSINADGSVSCGVDADTIFTASDAVAAVAAADDYVRNTGDVVTGPLSATTLTADVSGATADWSYWDYTVDGVVTDNLRVEEALCLSRFGVWDGVDCQSPLAYGTTTVTRAVTEAAAIASCPAGYTPADCDTALFLMRFWRLNSNNDAPGGHTWCAGTMDGGLNTTNAKRGMPGYWYSAGAAAPLVCPAGQAIVVDQCSPTENGCVGRASYHRPHWYCIAEGSSAQWMCISTSTP